MEEDEDLALERAIHEAMNRYFRWYLGTTYRPEIFSETLDEMSIWSDGVRFSLERYFVYRSNGRIYHVSATRDPLEVRITEYGPIRKTMIDVSDSQESHTL